MHASSLPETNKAHLEVGGASTYFRVTAINFQFVLSFLSVAAVILVPASDLCPLADVTIEIRAQSQVRSTVNQEVKICVYYTGGRRHPIDTSSRHPFFLKAFYPALKYTQGLS